MVYTQPTWGPTYIVSLKLYINSFDGPNLKNGQMAELIRFTTRSNNCCGIGDRIPAIFTDKRGSRSAKTDHLRFSTERATRVLHLLVLACECQ